MVDLVRDIRFGFRMFLRHPTVTVISLLTLALGVGASTAVVSVVNSTLLTPLPFDEPHQLVRLFATKPSEGWTTMTISVPNFRDWDQHNSSLEVAGIYGRLTVTVSGEEHPDQLRAIRASSEVLDVLRIQPTIGRSYDSSFDNPDAAPVVLISDAAWRGRFGGKPEIVGSLLRIDDVPHEVLGVLPPEVNQAMGRFDLWAPFNFGDGTENRSQRWFAAIARLRDGVTPAEADRDLKAIGERLAETYPDANRGHGVKVTPLNEVLVREKARSTLFALCAAVGFVLLIACVNIANLLLATAGSREREFAVRTALGAGPRQLMRQLLTETALLTLSGAVLGVVVALWGVDILTAGLEASVGRVGDTTVDLRVLGFTLLVLCATSIGIGLPVALRVSKARFSGAIQGSSRSVFGSPRQALRRDVLVASQVALALALLIGAGLMIRSLMALKAVDPGFDTGNLLTMRVSLPEERYPSDAERSAFFSDASSEIESLPGVRFASATSTIPLIGSNSNGSMSIEEHPISDPADKIFVGAEAVLPGFLEAIGIPLIEGREFTAHDHADSPAVIIINNFMARHFWPDESAIGKRVKFGPPDSEYPWMEVIGVMGDHRQTWLDTGPRFETLYAQAQFPTRAMTFVVKTEAAPGAMTADVQEAIWRIDPDLAVATVATMAEILDRNTRSVDDLANLLAGFGVVALVLALGGLYGITSFSVTQRTQEIGVRMALGAQEGTILTSILRRSGAQVLVGIVAGGLIAWWLSRLIRGMLFEVSVLDPTAYVGVATGMLAVGLVAVLAPALRAARIDPVVALRCE
jgi:putative ABC transport system permease protein